MLQNVKLQKKNKFTRKTENISYRGKLLFYAPAARTQVFLPDFLQCWLLLLFLQLYLHFICFSVFSVQLFCSNANCKKRHKSTFFLTRIGAIATLGDATSDTVFMQTCRKCFYKANVEHKAWHQHQGFGKQNVSFFFFLFGHLIPMALELGVWWDTEMLLVCVRAFVCWVGVNRFMLGAGLVCLYEWVSYS